MDGDDEECEAMNGQMNFYERACKMKHQRPRTHLEAILKEYVWADSSQVLDFVIDNWKVLRQADLLEDAFLNAWSANKSGVPNWDMDFRRAVFSSLDRARLMSAGDPLPAGDSFTIFRGVAGDGEKRRARGYSWTGSKAIAQSFADLRFRRYGLANPAVLRAIIQRQHVLAYINESGKGEEEFLLLPEHLSYIEQIAGGASRDPRSHSWARRPGGDDMKDQSRRHLTSPECIVKVGDGRGFIVHYRFKHPKIKERPIPVIVTAAHCLPNVPPAHPGSYTEERTFPNLLGTLDGRTNDIGAECLFVDPIADIAVLGPPDELELGEQAEVFEALTDGPRLRIAEPQNGKGWMLSLEGQWVSTDLEVYYGLYGRRLSTGPTVPGQSGSPILNSIGAAIGVVSLGHFTIDSEGKRKDERAESQPILRDTLPAWMLKQ